jgi:hypothetical protein
MRYPKDLSEMFQSINKEELIKKYESGLSINQIAADLNVGYFIARKLLVLSGAKIRPWGSVRKERPEDNIVYYSKFTDEDINFDEEIKTAIF